MDPLSQQLLFTLGGSKTTYVDDVFSTYLFRGNAGTQAINNGIDLAGEGGLVWTKNRTSAFNHFLYDTERGVQKYLISNSTIDQQDVSTSLTAFNSNGFTLGANDYGNITNGNAATSWTFRKAKGFFDIVTYTGTGTNTNADGHLDINHLLGSVPGCIMVKRTGATSNWWVYHRGLGATKANFLQSPSAPATNSQYWNDTDPTASQFTVGDGLNTDGGSYIAYVFAGGEDQTTATARSVDFDGSGDYLNIPDHADFDVGTNWTAECWFNVDSIASNQYHGIFSQWDDVGSNGYHLSYIGTDLRFYYASSTYKILGSPSPNQWHHVAISKEGSTTRIFLNGTQVVADFDMGTISSSSNFRIGRTGSSIDFPGEISNLRLVKGTAVYTSSFRPSTTPLTAITNTKLLCCNNSSVTGSTVTPGTITATGSPTASTDSPFDDPAGFKFGEEGDQNIIKTGSYVGNSTANHQIYVGWEPQWWLVKNITDSQNWQLLDSMRGWVSDGNDQYLVPNNNSADSAFNFGNPTSTGFNLSNASSNWQNESGKTYVYVAIRRPDGYVAKPAEAGTDAFAMDVGNAAGTITPAFDSGFPVDYGFYRPFASSSDWISGSRLTNKKYMKLNETDSETTTGDMIWDVNTGWQRWSGGTSVQAWMWKRGAGFDVVTYIGKNPSSDPESIQHSLAKIPEMMWVKKRSNTGGWNVYHKGLNGGTNPEQYSMQLNSTNTEGQYVNDFNSTAPTATDFTVGPGNSTNQNNVTYIALLFASVEGISKVGYYTGDGTSNRVITTGFTPRFLILRQVNTTQRWFVLDTARGWAAGNDEYLELNTSDAQEDYDFGIPTSNGFTPLNIANTSGGKYIYYAHA